MTGDEKRQVEKPFKMLADMITTGMKEAAAENHHSRPTPRFDGTISLGNVIQIITIGVALATFYANAETRQARMDSRVSYLESTQKDLRDSISKISDAEVAMAKSQAEMNTTLTLYLRNQPQGGKPGNQ